MENKAGRLRYIENLRVALMGLVIAQHAVRAYGSAIWWFVRDARAPLLERFTAVNSSFFMSLFFFISFYFLAPSYDRKGFIQFHKDRFLRLFVPLFVYAALISAGLMFAYFRLFRNYGPVPFFEYYQRYFLGLGGKPDDWTGPAWPDLNFGHLWFVEHLLVYGILYSLWRLAAKGRVSPVRRTIHFPSNACIALFAAAIAVSAFAVRVRYPLYQWIGAFGFLQMECAHMPFYLAFFIVGIASFRYDLLSQLPGKTGKLWFRIGLASAGVLALLPVESRFFGGFSPYAFAYAALEAFSCVGLIIGLLYEFWRYCDRQGSLMKTLSENSYLVYILHLPVVVFFQYILLGAGINPYLKFAIVLVASIPLTVFLSVAIRRIPFVRKYV